MVPDLWEDAQGFKLGKWVADQRERYCSRKLHSIRVDKLNRVPGWKWDQKQYIWELGYSRLLSYVELNAGAMVPYGYCDGDGFRLSRWVGDQRQRFRQGKMPGERQALLERIENWMWVVKEDCR
jgi:hypothetical protein